MPRPSRPRDTLFFLAFTFPSVLLPRKQASRFEGPRVSDRHGALRGRVLFRRRARTAGPGGSLLDDDSFAAPLGASKSETRSLLEGD